MADKKTPPSKGLPRWALILGALVVVLGGAALAAPYFIPWDRLKDQVTASASRSLGRELKVGAVEVGLFTGVHVKDISLANAKGEGFSKDPLFSVADAKVSVSLLSLLTGKVVVNSVTFDQPRILLETSAAGVSNLKGIGSASAQAPAAAKGEAKASGSLPVVVASLAVKDGSLTLRDRSKKAAEQSVDGLDLRLYGLSLAAAGGSCLEIKLDYKTEGKTIPLSLVCNFKLDLAGDRVDISSLDITAPAVAVNAKGGVTGLSKSQSIDLGLTVDLSLDKLADLLPPSALKKIPGELKSGGKISLTVQAKGPVADPAGLDARLDLAFDGVSLAYGSYPALTALQGKLTVDRAGADLPALTFKLAGDPATLALKARWGSLANLMGGAAKLKADVRLNLTSPKLNLDPVLAIALADDTPEEAKAKAEAKKDATLPDLRTKVPAGLTFNSLIEVDSLVAKTVKTGKLKQQIVLKDRKLQSATDLALYDGQFWERTAADFNGVGPVWKSQVGLSKLDFPPFLKDASGLLPDNKTLAELQDKVTGSLGFKADLKGKGFTPGTRLRNLQADGTFYLKDGVIRKTQWQENLAAVIPHPQTQEILRGDIKFSNAVGEFSHNAERSTLKSFTLGTGDDWRGGDLLLQASGFRAADGTLDFKVTPRFNPAKVHLEGALADAFNDKAGWPSYDYIAYYGPAGQAKADFKAGVSNAAKKVVEKKVEEVKQKAQEAVQQKAQEVIKDKVGDALKNQAGDALKGLFGR